MTCTLYDISVLNYLQTLGAVDGLLDRAQKHFRENNIALEEIVDQGHQEQRIAPGAVLEPAHQFGGGTEGARCSAR